MSNFKSKNETNQFFIECATVALNLSHEFERKRDQEVYKSPKWKNAEEQRTKYDTKHRYLARFCVDNDSALSLCWKMSEEQLLKIINASYSLEKLAALAITLKTKNSGMCFDDVTLQALAIMQEHEWKRDYTSQSLRLRTKRSNYKEFHAGTQQNYILNLLERVGILNASKGAEKVYSVNQSSPLLDVLKSITFNNPAK